MRAPLAEATEKDGAQALQESEAQLKQTEQALRESEGRYRNLFESAPDGILVADSEGTYEEEQERAEQVRAARVEQVQHDEMISAIAETQTRISSLRDDAGRKKSALRLLLGIQ